jgi:hypothetical protein
MSAEKMQYLWHLPRQNTAENPPKKKVQEYEKGSPKGKIKYRKQSRLNSTLSMFSWKWWSLLWK